MKRVICKLAILLGLAGSPTVLSTLHAMETPLNEHGVPDERWLLGVLDQLIADDEDKENTISRIIRAQNVDVLALRETLRESYKYKKLLEIEGTWRRYHNSWYFEEPSPYADERAAAQISIKMNEYYERQGRPDVLAQVLQQNHQKITEICKRLDQIHEQFEAVKEKMKQAERSLEIKNIPTHLKDNWKLTLLNETNKEIHRILSQCFIYIDQSKLPPKMLPFLRNCCGFKEGDKLMIFCPKKAINNLASPEQVRRLMEEATEEEVAGYIDDFWVNGEQVRRDPIVPTESLRLLVEKEDLYPFDPKDFSKVKNRIAKTLKNRIQKSYWRDYTIFLQAILEAPTPRLQKIVWLTKGCATASYMPTYGEFVVCGREREGAAGVHFGESKVLAAARDKAEVSSTTQQITMEEEDIDEHELGHLRDPFQQLCVISELIKEFRGDRTMDFAVKPTYVMQYDDSCCPENEWPSHAREDAEKARSATDSKYLSDKVPVYVWENSQEFWQSMGLYAIEFNGITGEEEESDNETRYFCVNPYCDNISFQQQGKPIRDQYMRKGELPARVEWQKPESLEDYKNFLMGVQEVNRTILNIEGEKEMP